jgi:hypothetical protein
VRVKKVTFKVTFPGKDRLYSDLQHWAEVGSKWALWDKNGSQGAEGAVTFDLCPPPSVSAARRPFPPPAVRFRSLPPDPAAILSVFHHPCLILLRLLYKGFFLMISNNSRKNTIPAMHACFADSIFFQGEKLIFHKSNKQNVQTLISGKKFIINLNPKYQFHSA